MLMSVPNVSEGSDEAALAAIGEAFRPAHLLDVHHDADHARSVFTLAAGQGSLAKGLINGVLRAQELVDVTANAGIHPHVGAVDVVPVVHLDPERRGAACAEALTVAELIGREAGIPVFLYGELAHGRERTEIRAGGLQGLAARIASGEQTPDFGPSTPHPTAGVTLVAARPPLVAFNVDLAAGATHETAREIAAELRESGGGLPGVRAIGLWLDSQQRAQVSCNVHDPFTTPLAEIVEFVRRRAPVERAELVGLAPRAAFDGFPEDVPLPGFDPAQRVLESVLSELS